MDRAVCMIHCYLTLKKTLFSHLLFFLPLFSSPWCQWLLIRGHIKTQSITHARTCAHTHTPPTNCLSMSSLGLMPASLFQSLSVHSCPHHSHCDPVALLALAFNLAVIQTHPSLHIHTRIHTRIHTHTQIDFLSGRFETNQTVVLEHAQMKAKSHQGTPYHTMKYSL